MIRLLGGLVVVLLLSCKGDAPQPAGSGKPSPTSTASSESKKPIPSDYDSVAWTEITAASGMVLDLRYASTANFTGKKIYPCGRCFLRPEVASRLLQLQQDVHDRYGWRLLLFDCYRPRPAQQRLWDAVPDATYVTPPHKGSMHNRGLAVDISLVDEDGLAMDMGTDFDVFGEKAHTDYLQHIPEVLRNRRILRKLMAHHGFKGIRTEWWHYSLRDVSAELSSWEWKCK